MQRVVFDEPYKFIPPVDKEWWPSLCQYFIRRHNDWVYGIKEVEFRGVEHLRGSIDAGHGILLAPNHCRPADPMLMGELTLVIPKHFYTMASWHLFKHSWLYRVMIRRMGGFSIYREGTDRRALNFAVDALVNTKRILVIYPEGTTTRQNDVVFPFLDGTAFIARTAAKRRAKLDPPGKVVIHPVAIRYFLLAELERSVGDALRRIEERLGWLPGEAFPAHVRVARLEEAALVLKEIEYFEGPNRGSLDQRIGHLVNQILGPLEEEWFKAVSRDYPLNRIKRLRSAILPDMVDNKVDERERARRWEQLSRIYYAQMIEFFPRALPDASSSPERILESVERMEEDFFDKDTARPPLKAVIQIAPAVEVDQHRERGGETDPMLEGIRATIQKLLDDSARRPRDAEPGRGASQAQIAESVSP